MGEALQLNGLMSILNSFKHSKPERCWILTKCLQNVNKTAHLLNRLDCLFTCKRVKLAEPGEYICKQTSLGPYELLPQIAELFCGAINWQICLFEDKK
jgi:hypothetical protein